VDDGARPNGTTVERRKDIAVVMAGTNAAIGTGAVPEGAADVTKDRVRNEGTWVTLPGVNDTAVAHTVGLARPFGRPPVTRRLITGTALMVACVLPTLTSCTRTVHHDAVAPREVTFSALSDLFAGPWADGVDVGADPDAAVVVTPDPAPADAGAPDPATPADAGLKAAPPPADLPKQPPAAPAGGGPAAPDPNNPILATIRQMESGNKYQAQAPGSSASGAYQILDETWAGFGGYTRAANAPPAVQDTKAAQLIIHALSPSEDVSRIPVIWYIGHVPAPSSREWDVVPARYAGNTLSPRAYQAKWLGVYDQKYAASQGAKEGS
jgi:hypothetical protein